MSSPLRLHGLQNARLPCPSLSPGVCSSSCPLSQWCYPTISASVTFSSSIFPGIRIFSNESALCIRWPKYWSFGFSVSPSNEYSRLISLRIYCFDFLAVQRTLNSLDQHHNSKTSILRCSVYGPTLTSIHDYCMDKTIALTRWTFVGKVMFLLFNMLSRLVIVFLTKSKCLLISWLQSQFQWLWSPPK